MAGWTTFLTLPVAIVLATLLHGSRWRPLEALFLCPLFLPPTVTGFLLLYILSPRHQVGERVYEVLGPVVFTPMGTILACIVVSFPLAFQACMVGVSRLSSVQLESAVVLGGTPVFNTVRVLWPQMRGAIGVAGILVFARALGEFGASIMVGGNIQAKTQTLPLYIFSAAESGRFAQAGQAALVTCLVGLAVYVALRLLEKSE